MSKRDKLLSIFCLVLGILSVGIFFAPIPIALSLSIISIFLFFIEVGLTNKANPVGIIGVIFGFFGLIVGIVYIYAYHYLLKYVDLWTLIEYYRGLSE